MSSDKPYQQLVVHSGAQGKGRAFRAVVLAWGAAGVWDKHEASNDRIRPAFLMIAAHGQEAGPVVANLRMGNPATVTGDGVYGKGMVLETLKSARYAWSSQRVATPGGQAVTVATARIHAAVAIDPGPVQPGEEVRFLIVPPRARLDEELARMPADDMRRFGRSLVPEALAKPKYDWVQPDVKESDDVWRYMPAMALWFCAMLDRRVAVPVLPDPLFQVQLYLAALREGIASWAKRDVDHYGDRRWGRRGKLLTEWGYDQAGLVPGVACAASQDQIRSLLVGEVRAWNDRASKRRRGGARPGSDFASARGE